MIFFFRNPDYFSRVSKEDIDLKLSTRGKYALYAMVYLAQKADEGPQPLRAIAQVDLPEQYLEQLLGSLRKAGLVTTVRGAQGGYHLTRPANEITVGMILRATEGDLAPAECVKSDVPCGRTNECSTRLVFEKVYSAINNVIDNVTLDELIPQCAKSVSGHA